MVAKFKQSDYNTQTGTEYPLALDASVAVLAELAAQFAVSAQDTPNLTVAMRAGRIYKADRTMVAVAAQNSATLTAPTVNPRNDIVVIDATTGAISVIAGAEAASPVDPAITANKLPKARIRWTVGMAQIANSVLDDLRFDAPSLDANIQYISANLAAIGAFPASNIPSGTAMLFAQTAAPTGWTKSTAHNNKALRVVSGAAGSGGATAFTSVFGAGKVTGSTTLTAAQSGLPDHYHYLNGQNTTGGATNVATFGAGTNLSDGVAGGPQNAAQGHDHTLSLDLQYVDVIIATKD